MRVLHSLAQGDIVRSVAFSPKGELIATAGGNDRDFNIRLWNVATGALERTLEGHRAIVWNVAFSPDGQLLASASADGTARVWNVAQGVMTKSLNFPNQVTSVAFSPDGETLAVGGVDRFPSAAVWTWAVASWKPILKLPEYWNIPSLAFAPDGQVLVGGGTSRNVRVWRTSNGVVVHVLNHPGQVADLAISPDGKRVATALCAQSADGGCQRGQVWIWDLDRGTLVKQLGNFGNWAQAVAFAHDGSILFAGSQDGTLAAWDSASFAPLPVPAAPASIEALAVSPDGRYLAIGCDDSNVYLYAVSHLNGSR
jgi:WD40 repeat protein